MCLDLPVRRLPPAEMANRQGESFVPSQTGECKSPRRQRCYVPQRLNHEYILSHSSGLLCPSGLAKCACSSIAVHCLESNMLWLCSADGYSKDSSLCML